MQMVYAWLLIKQKIYPIILLGSSYRANLVAVNETKKPVLILDYNKRNKVVV